MIPYNPTFHVQDDGQHNHVGEEIILPNWSVALYAHGAVVHAEAHGVYLNQLHAKATADAGATAKSCTCTPHSSPQ